MSLNDFVKELQNRYKGYVGINHVEMDVEEAQRNEGTAILSMKILLLL